MGTHSEKAAYAGMRSRFNSRDQILEKEADFMSELNQTTPTDEASSALSAPEINSPAAPVEGPAGLPTPSLPGSSPAEPIEGPAGLPTPSLPDASQGEMSDNAILRCPAGYQQGVVRNNQSFTDLLLENNVSYNAMRAANPTLSTTRIAVGTRYCAPPSGTRRQCAYGSRSYVMSQGESIYTLVRTLGISAGRLLQANPSLAPDDFLPGQEICLPQ